MGRMKVSEENTQINDEQHLYCLTFSKLEVKQSSSKVKKGTTKLKDFEPNNDQKDDQLYKIRLQKTLKRIQVKYSIGKVKEQQHEHICLFNFKKLQVK